MFAAQWWQWLYNDYYINVKDVNGHINDGDDDGVAKDDNRDGENDDDDSNYDEDADGNYANTATTTTTMIMVIILMIISFPAVRDKRISAMDTYGTGEVFSKYYSSKAC